MSAAEQGQETEALDGACPPGAEEALLGHFLEPDDLSDQNDFVGSMLELGHRRRRAILSRIFERCTWEGSCLLWQGPTSGSTGRGAGYGRFSFESCTAAVHRIVWAAVNGPIPGRKQVDHDCNNRACCNPRHLVLVTHKRNQRLRDERRNNSGL